MAGVNKGSFAEQLAARCKPLFEELRNEVAEKGIEKFDSYIKTINDTFDSQVGGKVDKLSDDVQTLFEGLENDIEAIKSSTGSSEDKSDSVQSDQDLSAIENAVLADSDDLESSKSDKISVINLVAKLKSEFDDFLSKDNAESEKTDKEVKKEEKKQEDKKKQDDKKAKAASSTAKRSMKLLDRIDKKVHESKLWRIIKWIGIILGGAILLPFIKPLWKALWAEVAAFFGYEDMTAMWTDIKTKVHNWLNENMPWVVDAVDWIKEKGESIWNVCQNIWKALEVIAGILKVPKATWDLITHPSETLKNAAESNKYMPKRDSFGNLIGWEISPAYVQAHPEEFISAESMAEGAATAEAAINAISVPGSTPVVSSQTSSTTSTTTSTTESHILSQYPATQQETGTGEQKASGTPPESIKQEVSSQIAGGMPNFYQASKDKAQQEVASGDVYIITQNNNAPSYNSTESSIKQ